MGGFGALSNMQVGGPGGLPDPEVIAATLPDQVCAVYTHAFVVSLQSCQCTWLVFFGIIGDSINVNSIITIIITFIAISMIVTDIDLVAGPEGFSDRKSIATTCMAKSIQETSALTGRWQSCL